jgi:hypothetical protein
MVLDLYISYVVSFLIGMALTFLLMMIFLFLAKKDIYQFLLYPIFLTFVGYSIFLFFNFDVALHIYSPIVVEILLVSILGFTGFFKRRILRRSKDWLLPHQALYRLVLNEAFFVSQIVQTFYTLYLFVALLCTHLPENSFRGTGFIRIFYHYVGVAIGLSIFAYEQIRVYMLSRKLGEEIWLPVLNDKGLVVGSVAYSVEKMSHKKYYHPMLRIAVVYQGMLYLTKREKDAYVSPDTLDIPFRQHILFRHSREALIQDIIGELKNDPSAQPRFMIHYTFENDKVKQLISLYAIRLDTEEQLKHLSNGKLWTAKQIEENRGANIFSEYFYKEFPYLQTTLLLAESPPS